MRRPTSLRVAALLLALAGGLAAVAGCGAGSGGSVPADDPVVSSSAQPDTSSARALSVEGWGVTQDGLLSVVVRNRGTRTINSARAIITARDANGNAIASVSAPLGTACCTVVGLAPGREFGLYSDLAGNAARTAHVSVAYTDVVVAAPGADRPQLVATKSALHAGTAGATVEATLQMSGSGGPYLTAQAFLQTSTGKLVAVVSGGFYCFMPGHDRNIALQFLHPLPPNTVVGAVVAFPLAARTSKAQKLPSCPAVATSRSSSSGKSPESNSAQGARP